MGCPYIIEAGGELFFFFFPSSVHSPEDFSTVFEYHPVTVPDDVFSFLPISVCVPPNAFIYKKVISRRANIAFLFRG